MSLLHTALIPFTADAFRSGEFIEVSERDVHGKWAVFFFYPANFTFVCPTELEDLADNYPTFQDMDVEVFSVSTDTHTAHKEWHESSEAIAKIQYCMIGDPAGTITRNFDNMSKATGLAHRGTFVIDPDGVIQLIEITPDGVGRNAEELVRKIKAAQYVRAHPDELCPANWHEGEATLTPRLNLDGKV